MNPEAQPLGVFYFRLPSIALLDGDTVAQTSLLYFRGALDSIGQCYEVLRSVGISYSSKGICWSRSVLSVRSISEKFDIFGTKGGSTSVHYTWRRTIIWTIYLSDSFWYIQCESKNCFIEIKFTVLFFNKVHHMIVAWLKTPKRSIWSVFSSSVSEYLEKMLKNLKKAAQWPSI